MELAPVVPALIALIEIAVLEGIDGVIDCVAAIAGPRYRFLRASWFRAGGAGNPARTLVARRGGRPIIALPVMRGRGGIMAVPGGYWPFRSFPVAADLADGEMSAFLADRSVRRALGPIWRLGPIYADDPALAALRRAGPRAGWHVVERRIATSFLLDIAAQRAAGAWPRTSTLRKNRFHEKHLAGHGALDWRFVRGDGWTDAVFDDLAAIERDSWIGQKADADAKFADPAMRRTWQALAADPQQADAMSAAMLYIGGAPAAFSFDMDVGTTKYAIANSYAACFAKHSPGKCLYYRNLAAAADRGIETVDWGAGDSGYKSTIGATPGAEIVDCLILRGPRPWIAAVAAIWRRLGQ